jgi:hypothetical protein
MNKRFFYPYTLLFILLCCGCTPITKYPENINSKTPISISNTPLISSLSKTIDYMNYWKIYSSNFAGYAIVYPANWFFSGKPRSDMANWLSVCNYSDKFSSSHMLGGTWNDDRITGKAISLSIIEFPGTYESSLLPLDEAIQLYTWTPDNLVGVQKQEWKEITYPSLDNPNRVEYLYKSTTGGFSKQVAFRTTRNWIIVFVEPDSDHASSIEIMTIINSTLLDINGRIKYPVYIPSEILTDEMFK